MATTNKNTAKSSNTTKATGTKHKTDKKLAELRAGYKNSLFIPIDNVDMTKKKKEVKKVKKVL